MEITEKAHAQESGLACSQHHMELLTSAESLGRKERDLNNENIIVLQANSLEG